MLLIKRSVWNVGNNKKKGSWEQVTVGLMLFRCDYAGTMIIIIISNHEKNQMIKCDTFWMRSPPNCALKANKYVAIEYS